MFQEVMEVMEQMEHKVFHGINNIRNLDSYLHPLKNCMEVMVVMEERVDNREIVEIALPIV